MISAYFLSTFTLLLCELENLKGDPFAEIYHKKRNKNKTIKCWYCTVSDDEVLLVKFLNVLDSGNFQKYVLWKDGI